MPTPSALGTVFSEARVGFARWAPLVWDPMGAELTARTAPAPGDHLLDACCGIGSSALPAARAVGPGGAVTAVDVAEGLLGDGRTRAETAGLAHVEFVRADVTGWSRGPYDVVQCAYGVFMLPDMDTGTAHLVGLVRPGGRFGISVWSRGSLEDFGRALYEVAGRHREPSAESDAPAGASPIRRIDRPDPLRAWLAGFGLSDVVVHEVTGTVALDPERTWDLVVGSGFRQALDGFTADTVATVRVELNDLLAHRGIHSVTTTTLFGVGVRT